MCPKIEYLGIERTAERLGVSGRRVRQMCASGKLPGAVKKDGAWRVPVTADARLGSPSAAEQMPGELKGVPEIKRRAAIRKLGVIQRWRRFAAAGGGVEVFAGAEGVSERSLWRWCAAYRAEGLLGLVDNRGGGQFLCELISPEAFEMFKSLYLDEREPTVKQCWQNVCFVNKDRDMGWRVPRLDVMYRFVKDHIPLAVRVLHRQGLSAYEAKCAPYIESEPDSVEPGQVWVGDHSPFNCWIRHRGRWIRPWITAWQDLRSRKIVGHYVNASPNQTTILVAFKRAIEQCGPPEEAKIDNGRDYDSEMWTGRTKAARRKRRAIKKGYIDEQMVAGIYAMMGVGVTFAIPYHPQSKPIERFFDTMDVQLVKTIPTYCGKDTARRPEDLAEYLNDPKNIADAYDLDQFGEVVGQYIEVYNASAHTGKGMEGRTPAEVFESRTSRRVLVEGVAELLCRVWSRPVKVGKNGVRHKGLYYGQFDSELLMNQGRAVRLAYDPDDVRQVDVYDAKTLRLITTAEQNQLVRYGRAVGEEQLREAMRQKSRALKAVKGHRDAQLTANMDLTDLTLRAMAEGAEKGKKTGARSKEQRVRSKRPAATIRPVATAMDDQVREHERQKVVRAVKRACGAEKLGRVLDMDFSLLKGPKKHEGVKLFDG